MIRVVQRTGAAAALVAAVLLWLPAPAEADSTQVGWWNRYRGQSAESAAAAEPLQTGDAGDRAPSGDVGAAQAPTTLPPAPVPPPTVPVGDPPGVPGPVPPLAAVPEGGLYVANDPAGPSAVSALRIASGPVGEATLTLAFAESPSVASGAVAIVACPILAGFQAVTNGAWVDRPAHDCQRIAVTGVLDSAGTGLTWTLPSGFQTAGSEVLEVILVPVAGDGTAYSVAFEAPAADALRTLGPPPPPTTPPTTVFQPDPAAPAAEFNQTPVAGGTAVAGRPGPGAAGDPDTPVAAEPAPPGQQGPASDPPSVVSPIARVLDDRPWARWVATGILVAIAAALLLASRREPVVATGASAAGGRHRGIGRFASARSGHPPAVS